MKMALKLPKMLRVCLNGHVKTTIGMLSTKLFYGLKRGLQSIQLSFPKAPVKLRQGE